jgi:hypothetical protein
MQMSRTSTCRCQKPTSKTERDSFFVEDLVGIGGHYKTTITDGNKKSVGLGRTSEESQRNAKHYSDKKKNR